RKRLTPQQLQVLNYVFSQNPFPSIEERLYLSERLWISARSIQIWFQNKRQIVKSNTR
ncbi:PAX37B protein, partial [Conidiobolus coronatus NRRL 28638]